MVSEYPITFSPIGLRLLRDLHAGLEARGFRTSLGDDGAGIVWLVWSRVGGFYLGKQSSIITPEVDEELKQTR